MILEDKARLESCSLVEYEVHLLVEDEEPEPWCRKVDEHLRSPRSPK
jgi:hypothetical protein